MRVIDFDFILVPVYPPEPVEGGVHAWHINTSMVTNALPYVTYRGVRLTRTMEYAKKPYELANSYELAAPCKSNFLTKLWIFHPEFRIIPENKDFTKLMSTF